MWRIKWKVLLSCYLHHYRRWINVQWINARNAVYSSLLVGDGQDACSTWHKSPGVFYKCNIDAAVFYDLNAIGVGYVIRDDFGVFVQCRSTIISGLPSVKECEALALREALAWVTNLGFVHMQFQIDARNVVEAINNEGADLTELGFVIRSCQSFLLTNATYSV
ncbi:hypothetical protein PTKIN_Ptkin05aG0107100 [Pterospermum kingtungense]